MSLYIYCLANTGEYLEFNQCGFQGGKIFFIVYRDICAVVSEISINKFEATDDHLFLHEKIIESVMDLHTVLPMRFNSILPDEQSVIKLLEDRYQLLKDNLKRLENKWEFGLKAIWDREKIKQDVFESPEYKDFMNKFTQIKASPANEYLKGAMLRQFVDKELAKKAKKIIDEFNQKFQGITVDVKYQVLCTSKLFCNISYLIPRDKTSLVHEIQEEIYLIYPDFKFLFSGPWPPYNFVDMGEE